MGVLWFLVSLLPPTDKDRVNHYPIYLDEDLAPRKRRGCVARSGRIANVRARAKVPVLVGEGPGDDEELLPATVGVRGEGRTRGVAYDGRGPSYFAADPVEGATVDSGHGGGDIGLSGPVDDCKGGGGRERGREGERERGRG